MSRYCSDRSRQSTSPTFRFFAVLVSLCFLVLTSAYAGKVQQVTSPGGIVAWLVEDHSIPITSIEFSFRGGAALDPVGKTGLANFVASVIDEGAGNLDSQAFQGRLYDLSVTLRYSVGFDTFRGSLKTLNRHRKAAINLLRMSLAQPRFDPEPVERIRQQILSSIRRRSNNPTEIASRTLWRAVFSDHPYSRTLQGTEKSVNKITKEDIRTFASRRLAKDNLIAGVVGDITAEELAPLLDEAFGDLPNVAASSQLEKAYVAELGKIFVVERDVPQSVIMFSQPGIARGDLDYYAAYVMNHILGGGAFSSRLYEEIREKRGLAYSVYSYINPLDAGSILTGSVSTENARAGRSLEIVRAEWSRMSDKGISEEELNKARQYITGSWPLRFDNVAQMARMLVGMQYNELGIEYLDMRNDYINAVTREDINRVARRILDVAKLTVVVVGKPLGIRATAEVLDEDG